MSASYTRTHLGDLIARAPITIDTGATLRAAAETMFRENAELVVVTKEGQPVGVLSERDVVNAIAQGADPAKQAVAETATPFFITAKAHDTLLDATLQMIDAGTRHVIVDHDDRFIGVLSIRELMTPVLLQALGMAPEEHSLSAAQAQVWWRVAPD